MGVNFNGIYLFPRDSVYSVLHSPPHNDPRAGQVPRQVGAAVPVPPPPLPRVGRVQRLVQPDGHDIRRSRHVHQAAHVRPQHSPPLTASIVWGAFALAVFGYVNQQPLRQSKDASSPLLVLGCVLTDRRPHADHHAAWHSQVSLEVSCPRRCSRPRLKVCPPLRRSSVSRLMRTCIVYLTTKSDN